MPDHRDYDEPAALLAFDHDTLRPGRIRTTTLADAVRTVVEEWTGERLVDVFIATPTGPIQGLEEVRAIYERRDFARHRSEPAE